MCVILFHKQTHVQTALTFNCRDRQEAQDTEVERVFRLRFIDILVLRVPLSGWKDRIWSVSL